MDLYAITRAFQADSHIVPLDTAAWVPLYDEAGLPLPGIRGKMGVVGQTAQGVEFGIDLIEMTYPARFPLHVHPGDHILLIQAGRGLVHVDGTEYSVGPNDTVFIPADYPHGVMTDARNPAPFSFYAIGIPHKHISSTDRMHVVEGS